MKRIFYRILFPLLLFCFDLAGLRVCAALVLQSEQPSAQKLELTRSITDFSVYVRFS